jgi:hypothetical protein
LLGFHPHDEHVARETVRAAVDRLVVEQHELGTQVRQGVVAGKHMCLKCTVFILDWRKHR